MESPRLKALAGKIDGRDDANDLRSFWLVVSKKGAPLVERVPGQSSQIFVTFLWRRSEGAADRYLAVFGEFNDVRWQRGDPLVRLRGTDVLYKTYRMDAAVRSPYLMVTDSAAALGAQRQRVLDPEISGEGQKYYDLFLDPLNPRVIDDVYFRMEAKENVFEGPDAPREKWLSRMPVALSGRVDTIRFKSRILGNERDIFVYVPKPPQDNSSPSLLVMFDGNAFLRPGRVPEMMDRMISAGEMRPTVGVFIDTIDFERRGSELPPNDLFPRFIAEELIPEVRKRYGATADPARTVIAGASYGGLAANYIAMTYPDIFGNVLSQSASLWWSPDGKKGTNWLAGKIANSQKLPIRFYMQAGTLESKEDILDTNRYYRDELRLKGYDLAYEEFVGGHTYYNWRAALPRALKALLPQPVVFLSIQNRSDDRATHCQSESAEVCRPGQNRQ